MSFIKLCEETGKFTYSNSGYYHSLIFEGDNKFVERTTNLLINFEILKFGTIKEIDNNGLYSRNVILVPENRLIDGLKTYFRGEIIQERKDIDYEVINIEDEDKFEQDVRWNEEKVVSLVNARFNYFWNNVVVHDNILAHSYESGGLSEFALGTLTINEE